MDAKVRIFFTFLLRLPYIFGKLLVISGFLMFCLIFEQISGGFWSVLKMFFG